MSRNLLQVFRATNHYGEVCHFGVASAAKAWAKGGEVETINVREAVELRVVNLPATDDAAAIKNLSKALANVVRERDQLRGAIKYYRIDNAFTHRLAVMLECVLLGGKGTWDEGHALLDEYREACRIESNEVPTCMGEPVTDVRAHVRAAPDA